jgi:hypothetical protein
MYNFLLSQKLDEKVVVVVVHCYVAENAFVWWLRRKEDVETRRRVLNYLE